MNGNKKRERTDLGSETGSSPSSSFLTPSIQHPEFPVFLVNNASPSDRYFDSINSLWSDQNCSIQNELTFKVVEAFNEQSSFVVMVVPNQGSSVKSPHVPMVPVRANQSRTKTIVPLSEVMTSSGITACFPVSTPSPALRVPNDFQKVSKHGLSQLLKKYTGKMLIPHPSLEPMTLDDVVVVLNALFSEDSPVDRISDLVKCKILRWV